MWYDRASKHNITAVSVVLLTFFVCLSAGCYGARTLTISQTKLINTGAWANKVPSGKEGDPLELAIVLVYSRDWQKDINQDLDPKNAQLTCRNWYGREAGGRNLGIPRGQVFLFSDEATGSQRLGPAVRGAKHQEETIEKKLRFSAPGTWRERLIPQSSIVYVFGKFLGPSGEVLTIPPARFPSSAGKDVKVRVGRTEDTEPPFYGQLLEAE